MIKNVSFNSKNIQAGGNILLTVDADYPITIDIYCFVTYPPPPKFTHCPDSGQHILAIHRPFKFKTDAQTFENNGYVEFRIVDATGDLYEYKIEIEGLASSLLS